DTLYWMPRLSRLIAPAIEQLYERTLVDFHLLQRMAFNSGNNAGHKPVLETKFNHGYERAILIEGGEAFPHVVRFTHRAKVPRSFSAASMMAHPRRLPHSILTAASAVECWGRQWGRGSRREQSEFWQRAGQHLEAEVFLVAESVGTPLDDAYLRVEPFNETQGHLVLRLTVGRDAVPVVIDHLGELLISLQALPFEGCSPVLEELPRPRLALVVPELSEGFLQHIRRVEALVGLE